MVWNSNGWGLNQITMDHPNSERIRYSSPHCNKVEDLNVRGPKCTSWDLNVQDLKVLAPCICLSFF